MNEKLNKSLKFILLAGLSTSLLAGCTKGSTAHEVKHVARTEARYAAYKGIRHHFNHRYNNGENNAKNHYNTDGDSISTENKSGDYNSLANSNYKSGTNPVIKVNNDKAQLSSSSWKTEKIAYSNLDSLNRTGTATAYLSKKNLGKSKGRDPQVWDPTGWHNQAIKVNGKRVFPQNRGHLIAYTLSFNFDKDGSYKQGLGGSLDNPKNLATQTAFSNQKPMQHSSEDLVRNALEQNKKVIYKVTPVFQGKDLMPKGYWVQALSTDGSLNFNRFIYNVQPGVKFDYSTGRSSIDSGMIVQ